ncbi:MAG: GNAT family N-acetyltransferase [Pseudomonadota bacterium]
MSSGVRHAHAGDLPAIRDIQLASWRSAYSDVLPPAFLEQELPGILEEKWRSLPEAAHCVLVHDGEGGPDGFANVIEKDGKPYVDNLHVHPEHWRSGIGAGLVAGVVRSLTLGGQNGFWLTVIVSNHRARAFYTRMGGKEGPEMTESLYGNPVRTVPVHWSDLGRIAGQGGT